MSSTQPQEMVTGQPRCRCFSRGKERKEERFQLSSLPVSRMVSQMAQKKVVKAAALQRNMSQVTAT